MRPAKNELENWLDGTRSQVGRSQPTTPSHVTGGRPKFPRDLKGRLRAHFKRLCQLLAERRALTKGDVELLRLYVIQHDRHQRNWKLLLNEGEVCTYTRLDSNGQPHDVVKVNVRLKICQDSERQMVAILSQLGLSPVTKDRAKPTAGASVAAVVPGSMADLYPEMLSGKEEQPPVVQPIAPPESEEEDNVSEHLG